MAQILVVRPGTLTAGDKRKLRGAGVVTVEAENPNDVRLITPEGPAIGGDDLTYAALQAIARGGQYASDVQTAFPKILFAMMKEYRDGSDKENPRSD